MCMFICIAAINPTTGQPDYTAAWIEYYRQQGLHYQADQIMRQAQAMQGGAGGQPPAGEQRQ